MDLLPPSLLARYEVPTDRPPLGKGAYGTVHECIHRASGKVCALKVMRNAPAEVRHEVEVMRAVSGHKRIANLHEAAEAHGSSSSRGANIALVLDHCAGGELFDRIVQLERFSENDAACLFKKVLRAIDHVHHCRVVHRDLKPENIMLVSRDNDTNVKLIDFGLASFVPVTGAPGAEAIDKGERPLLAVLGSADYQAPEMISYRGYGRPADMWSLGIILYILLCGGPPFDEGERDFEGKLEFPEDDFAGVSEAAIDLCKGLLQVDPLQRLSAAEAITHPWFKAHHERSHSHSGSHAGHAHGHEHGHGHGRGEAGEDAADPWSEKREKLKSFNAKRRFRRVVLAVLSINRMQRMMLGFPRNSSIPADEVLASAAAVEPIASLLVPDLAILETPRLIVTRPAELDAGCICGDLRIHISTKLSPVPETAVVCRCRSCTMNGLLLWRRDRGDVVLSGKPREFDRNGLTTHFCAQCGSAVCVSAKANTDSIWINLRVLDGFGTFAVKEVTLDSSFDASNKLAYMHTHLGSRERCFLLADESSDRDV